FFKGKIIIGSCIGIGQFLYPWLASPYQSPIFPVGRCEYMIVLCLNTMIAKISIHDVHLLVGVKPINKRPSGLIRIYYEFKGVVMQPRLFEVPVIVICFI